MRHSMTSATALLISVMLGVAAAQGQNAAPPAHQPENQPPAQKENPLPGSPQHQGQVDRAINSESGRAGKDEPLPRKDDNSVFVNGALNVPGAPKDSETVPAKFSARNATLDKLPIIAAPLWLNDQQRQKIAATLRTGSAPVASTDTALAGQIPLNVEMLDLPDALKREIPDVQKLKYVRAGERILLVDPPNRIVVGEIKD